MCLQTEAIDAISRSSLEHELAAKERQVSLIAQLWKNNELILLAEKQCKKFQESPKEIIL